MAMVNGSTEMFRELFRQSFREDNFVVIGLYVPVFIIALFANILVIVVILQNEYMRSVTNYFLMNLSVADLLVAIVCMPNAAWLAYTKEYDFGEYTCKITSYLQCISVASSIFTITAMAIDRYFAITRPFGLSYRSFGKKTTVIVITSIWISSLILFSPILDVTKLNTEPLALNITIPMCVEDWSDCSISRHILGIVYFTVMFAVPGVVVLFAYSMMGRTLCLVTPPFDENEGMSSMQQRNKVIRGRKRAACVLLTLAFAFNGCWLPFHIIHLLRDTNNLPNDTTSRYNISKVLPYLLLLGHSNSALNPIIYCALSRKFRGSIKDLFGFEAHITRRQQPMHVVHQSLDIPVIPKAIPDSSGSGTQLHYLHRILSVPTIHNRLHFTLNRRQSSQKTKSTKTCAV